MQLGQEVAQTERPQVLVLTTQVAVQVGQVRLAAPKTLTPPA